MLGLAEHLALPDVAFLVPQAHDFTWYPQRFLAPLVANEPFLSSAISLVGTELARLEAAGIPAARSMVLGFSQGACLALEYASRHPRRYGAIVGLSGALIGPPDLERRIETGLDATPVFLGSSDQDFHVPASSIEETARTLTAQGGSVDLRFYPGMGHTINQDELDAVTALLERLRAS
jgi:predicted esterase